MWLIIFLVLGSVLTGLVLWLRSKAIKVSWYEWLIGAVGLILLLFSISNYFGARAELVSSPLFLTSIGIPALILIAVAGLLVWRRHQAQA